MTPQEKAEELINFFNKLTPAKLSDYTRIYLPSAKLCALKVCDEVLSNMSADREYAFWSNVKQEIEKY